MAKVTRTYWWQWYERGQAPDAGTPPDGDYISDWALTHHHLADINRCQLRPAYWLLKDHFALGRPDPEEGAARC